MNVCLDACFLIGLYDSRDQYHARARDLFAEYFEQPSLNVAVLVWPVLYEAVSTRLVRQHTHTSEMERELKSLRAVQRLDYLDDAPYRDQAFEDCFMELGRPRGSYRALSLTDRVLRSVLSDVNVRIDAILTFNVGDFSDVCQKSGRTLLS